MFAVTPGMEPIEKDDNTQTDAYIYIEIVVKCFIFDKYKIVWNIISKSPTNAQNNKTCLLNLVLGLHFVSLSSSTCLTT